MTDTLQTLKEIMSEKTEVNVDDITLESTLENLELDSLDLFEIVFSVEDAFHIKVPDNRLDIKTVRNLVDLIDELVTAQHG
ncbi:MAG: acyl carrier protein [Methylococcaceae bacterium]|nr:MAG: acyl carrier protein [Methylococcaceae bacterium]